MSNKPINFTMKLEVVPIAPTDIERSKDFYANKVGFNVDHDHHPDDSRRVIQLTPPGSGCSIVLGQGIGDFPNMTPGSVRGLHLVVEDIQHARETLLNRGVHMEAILDMGGIKFAGFADPDGNTWVLQEIPPEHRG